MVFSIFPTFESPTAELVLMLSTIRVPSPILSSSTLTVSSLLDWTLVCVSTIYASERPQFKGVLLLSNDSTKSRDATSKLRGLYFNTLISGITQGEAWDLMLTSKRALWQQHKNKTNSILRFNFSRCMAEVSCTPQPFPRPVLRLKTRNMLSVYNLLAPLIKG